MARLVYRRIGNQQSIVGVHSVNTAAGGGGVRWYEFRIDGSSNREALSARHLCTVRRQDSGPRYLLQMDGEPGDGQGRQHRHRLFVRRGRSISPASDSRRARAGDPLGQLTLARSGAGRRRGGADLDLAMAGLHADGDRSRRRLHHLVCWRLREEGRERVTRRALARFKFLDVHTMTNRTSA